MVEEEAELETEDTVGEPCTDDDDSDIQGAVVRQGGEPRES